VKIISWNVNGIRAVHKKGFMDFWHSFKPDILSVQETKAHQAQLTDEILHPSGFLSYWAEAQRKGYSGVATFLKEPVKDAVIGIGNSRFDDEGRVVVTQHEGFSLFNIYFPNGARGPERHQYKMEFLKYLNETLKPRVQRGEPIIVVGDYNVAPADIDIYDPIKHARTSGFLPEEKEWFQSFLKLGFIDTFRHQHPGEKNRYSWWNQMERARLGNRGWRIDLICITKNLEKYLVSSDIHDDIEGSDHCPISITLS